MQVKLDDFEYGICNIYAPNIDSEKCTFFQHAQDAITSDCDRLDRCCIVGDFNTVSNNNLDIIAGNPHNSTTVTSFQTFMTQLNLYDIWRIFHLDSKEFTWNRSSPFIARRLDYILCSESVSSLATSSDIISIPGSDHKGVELCIQLSEVKRGPYRWIFNEALLTKPTYIQLIHGIIEDVKVQTNLTNGQLRWDYCKKRIKEETIQFCKMQPKNPHRSILDIKSELECWERRLASLPDDLLLQSKCIALKKELELLTAKLAKGAQIRSRIKWVEEGERNSKYFFSLEKSRAKSKIISSLTTESGEHLTDQQAILDYQYQYYKNLYAKKFDFDSRNDEFKEMMRNSVIPQIPEPSKPLCEGTVSLEEAEYSLKQMNTNSAPGSDGLTVEFYRKFWDKIGPLVIESFEVAHASGSMSVSQRRGIITLIHKDKDLPRDLLNNWRPITLTNVDYKILAKCMARRLQNVLKTYIDEDQVGYIKGRSITTVVRLIDDVLEYVRYRNETGIIIAIDYTKAFDSINKQFICKALQCFGVGPSFLQWVSVLMKDTESCIQYNGWTSPYFHTARGVRQGCPLSPLLFITAVELLGILIRQNNQLSGIKVPDWQAGGNKREVRIAQYADDTTFFTSDFASCELALTLVERFALVSGLHLNKRKTKGMVIGAQIAGSKPLDLCWVPEGGYLKILGIYFSASKPASDIELNWENRMHKMNRIICQWHKRDLSIMGKILIVKTFLISQLVYIMQAISIPDEILKTINTMIFRFIWKRKFSNKKAFEKVKRDIIIGEYELGGLKMIDVFDLQHSFDILWVKRLVQNSSSLWAQIHQFCYKAHGRVLGAFRSNCDVNSFKGLSEVPLPFWQKLLKTWLKYNVQYSYKDISPVNPLNENLWNNHEVMYKGAALYFKNWAERGIICLADLVKDGEFMSCQEVSSIVGNHAQVSLQYNAVINAIPAEWQDYFCNPAVPQRVPLFWDDQLTRLNAKQIRRHLVGARYKTSHGELFWSKKYEGFAVTKDHWMMARHCTREIRLQVLAWKLLHNIYPTSVLLCKMGVTESNQCRYCPGVTDFVEHFFYTCRISQTLWTNVAKMLTMLTGNCIHLSEQKVLFGVTHEELPSKDMRHVVNLCILIGKMCISKYKYGSSFNIICIFESEMFMRVKHFPISWQESLRHMLGM